MSYIYLNINKLVHKFSLMFLLHFCDYLVPRVNYHSHMRNGEALQQPQDQLPKDHDIDPTQDQNFCVFVLYSLKLSRVGVIMKL